MAISHISTTYLGGISYLSGTYPAVQAGDLLVATLATSEQGKQFSAKSGWTPAGGKILFKLATGSESGTEVFSTTDTIGLYNAAGRLVQYRGDGVITLHGESFVSSATSPLTATRTGVPSGAMLFGYANVPSQYSLSVSLSAFGSQVFLSRGGTTNPGFRIADAQYESGTAEVVASFTSGTYVYLTLLSFVDSGGSTAANPFFFGGEM